MADFAQIRESYRMRRSGVAKKYAREEQATHERRQRAVGSRRRWECMKDHPTSSFLFVSMLMDRLTSEAPGVPMDDDVCRVYCGESRVQKVYGKSEFHAGQKPINFHSNTLKHYFPYIYLVPPIWFIGTGVFTFFKKQHWQDITRTCCNLSNPSVPTCKNLCQATKFDLKKWV